MITSEQLYDTLRTRCQVVLVTDSAYSLPDRAYMSSLAWRWKGVIWNRPYADQSFDCDDFSILAMSLARLDHSSMGEKRTGFAVGFAAIDTDAGGHMVVLACHMENGVIVPVLYEPQNQGALCLSEYMQPVLRWRYCFI